MRNPSLRLATVAAVAAVLMLVPGLAMADEAASAPGTIQFKASNKMYSADGKFESWKFTEIDIPEGDLEKGRVEIEIDLASVWEKAADLAKHLRQSDFFDVEKYLVSTLTIDRVKKTDKNTYEGIATVKLHGHTDEVPVNFEVVSESPLHIRGTATLQRTAFGIGGPYDPSNDRSITDDVLILIDTRVE